MPRRHNKKKERDSDSRFRRLRDGQGWPPAQRRISKRNERKHVERADARMSAGMHAQIDTLERDAGKPDGGLDDLLLVTDDRQDAAVMDGIAAPVEQSRAG